MEYKSESEICQNCKKEFVIEPDDFGFYEKINVPPPTFCPDCRSQRRLAWRNDITLYNRECNLCKKQIVTIYSKDSGITIYCNKCWWSDKWDPKSYAMDYDFSKPFFTQMKDLIQRVPHMAIVNDDGIASINCEYTHDWWFSKNCYMCFSGWHVEDVMYSFFVLAGRDIMDCMIMRSKSERVYESFLSSGSYNIKNSNVNRNCIDCQFMYDCFDCQNCFMCTGMRNKRFYFRNKEYSKEEYEKILESYRLDTYSGVEKAQEEYDEFILKHPRRHVLGLRNINSEGDIISDNKNCKNMFVAKNCQDSRYCEFVGDASGPIKDCYDTTMTGGASECYESVTADHSQLNLFCLLSPKSQDLRYTQHCHSSKYLFGCVGLRNGSYCILNKQYTKEKYEELVSKIIEQMNMLPYIDKTGNIYKYGEYYPAENSPFGYNESSAMEEFPLTKEETLKRGFRWQDNLQRTMGKETIELSDIPNSIDEVNDSILEEVLSCRECKRNYKIMQNELIFYRKMRIPIPRKCFYCRHNDRLKRRNPFKLWHRKCMCKQDNHEHKGECSTEFETSYVKERPEIVYCEKCYQAEVY